MTAVVRKRVTIPSCSVTTVIVIPMACHAEVQAACDRSIVPLPSSSRTPARVVRSLREPLPPAVRQTDGRHDTRAHRQSCRPAAQVFLAMRPLDLDIDAERRTMEPLRAPHRHGHQDDPWIIHECPSSTTHAHNRPTTPTHRCRYTGSGGLGRCEARHLHDTHATPDCQESPPPSSTGGMRRGYHPDARGHAIGVNRPSVTDIHPVQRSRS